MSAGGPIQPVCDQRELPLSDISGSLEECARQYGEKFAGGIRGFYATELKPTYKKLAYAKRCLPLIEEGAPEAFRWMTGMARPARLSVDEAALLFLHEENAHKLPSRYAHCTALVSAGESSLNGETLCGQTWDAQDGHYPLAGVLRTKIDGSPSILSYHFPGLPFCSGVNDQGLAMLCTSSGVESHMEQKEGIPTYALMLELLMEPSVEEAARYLGKETTRNAGFFNLLLADRSGDTLAVEGVPGHIETLRGEPLAYRSNLYEFEGTKSMSGQDTSDEKDDFLVRRRTIEKRAEGLRGRLTEDGFKDILTKRRLFVPRTEAWDMMTIDTILANASDGTLQISRGGKSPGPWRTYGF